MDADRFRDDLDGIPAMLDRIADALDDGLRWPWSEPPRRLLLTGMGSSYFAADVVARRLRAGGVDAVAEPASARLTWPAHPDLVVVGISASGGSPETLHTMDRHVGTSRTVALTNVAGSPVTERADHTVDMLAGPELGGVACRSFRATIALLLALERQWFGTDVVAALRTAAEATDELLSTSPTWLPGVVDTAVGPDGTWLLAPAERLSSSLQGALMLREGPRLRADGCETGDWSHVDVYLTKTHDYRAVVFTGSEYDGHAADWLAERGSTVVSVGGTFPGAGLDVGYRGCEDPLVALVTEVLVPELVAASVWSDQQRDQQHEQ